MHFWLKMEDRSLVILMALAHPSHPIKSRSRISAEICGLGEVVPPADLCSSPETHLMLKKKHISYCGYILKKHKLRSSAEVLRSPLGACAYRELMLLRWCFNYNDIVIIFWMVSAAWFMLINDMNICTLVVIDVCEAACTRSKPIWLVLECALFFSCHC